MSPLVQLQVARQICDGMDQLSLLEVVHRDLAARNVLVFSLDPQDHLATARPVRLMVPESIERRQYSEKSDVWAFGVTMWLVWTYGKVPYWAITDDSLVGPRVVYGERLAAPSSCSPQVYLIIRSQPAMRRLHRCGVAAVTGGVGLGYC
ncbi:hypothetical protein GUITHDRAFT_66176 [Guillardia theta CCMP2712]|uniref:Protein kinase domain-containing protein n=1 Tax=Guillardia theta (strain CCMP2712) TaxID=905079 RepID=L1JSP2_GUITC|nr:hypothetical protein GUITHDRAFT_66176 [Guillardia theta CCMP2712]EKX51294.1 hypothetical protein GUITHDRAFT_66176 [Guillardia theta CCMP2712]|eukprot:XP_005838274.1 hypothetical protein GUITHDRAFT_66176 [Guillardia theta CCMP2712]